MTDEVRAAADEIITALNLVEQASRKTLEAWPRHPGRLDPSCA